MINDVVLVGRLTKDPELIDTDNGKKRAYITLAVPRKFKNVDGIYETDFIRVTLWNIIALNTNKDSEDNVRYSTDVIAEQITFLTSKKGSNTTIASDEEE